MARFDEEPWQSLAFQLLLTPHGQELTHETIKSRFRNEENGERRGT